MDRATIAVTAGRPPAAPAAPLNEPVEFASALTAGGDVVYTRTDARNSRAFEQVLGALEGGEAVLFASGMAAITAVLDVTRPASVTRPEVMYSGTRAVLEQRGLPHGPDMTWVESPSNPDLRLTDIAAVAEGPGLTVVDNTFATPLGQRPLHLGADVVVHSVSKYLGGHSDLILGAVVCTDPDLITQLRRYRELGGAIPGPMEAWLALRGMRTLDVRLRRAAENAAVLARRLSEAGHHVIWPGLPSHPDYEIACRQMDIITPVLAVIADDAEHADQVCSRTRVWRHATSLGGVESTLERRRTHRLESEAVDPALIRLSVGIEHVDDLWDDLAAALTR